MWRLNCMGKLTWMYARAQFNNLLESWNSFDTLIWQLVMNMNVLTNRMWTVDGHRASFLICATCRRAYVWRIKPLHLHLDLIIRDYYYIMGWMNIYTYLYEPYEQLFCTQQQNDLFSIKAVHSHVWYYRGHTLFPSPLPSSCVVVVVNRLNSMIGIHAHYRTHRYWHCHGVWCRWTADNRSLNTQTEINYASNGRP